MNGRPEIIISGVSGRFSNCANIDQLKDRLYKGVDMSYENEERWPKGTYGLPTKSGALMDLQNFDASFFGLTNEEADLIDPSTRCNIETTFEALCDAGLNPWNLGKRKVGLFHGQTNNEMHRCSVTIDGEKPISLQLQERLIAYIFDIKNGVFPCETACSSALIALNEAFVQLTHGHIDLAIVSCANIMWAPAIALSYHRLSLTSQIGECRFLDASASGYGRSETAATLILERSCDAQRIHGQLIFSFTNCDGYKPQGITYPSWESQASLIRKCYEKVNIDPTTLDYFECHGTGTQVGDMVEIKALWSIMGDRQSKLPLLLGSIKSNLGHSEAGSGLSSLIKCLLIFKLNAIPPNLHYEKPSPLISELEKGFVAPVTQITPFNGKYISVNNFGFGGANSHVIVGRPNKNDQDKTPSSPTKEEAILILCCGRTEISLQTMVNGIISLKPELITPHFAHLINRYSYFMSTTINPERMMNHRSYIISSHKSFKTSSPHELPPNSQVPICFAFPGAGAQIHNMIQPFMSLKPFRESIEDSLAFIDPDGSKSVRETLFSAGKSHWKIFAFGIFQMAVVDTLKSMGIVPDIIVGHSFGEYACAYADGILSKAEVLDICYSIAQIINSTINESQTFKSCSMISVALTWDELSPLISNDLYPACFNTHDNITLAGYTEDVVQFSNHLKVQNIFHKIIDSCGFGFHTPALGKLVYHLEQKLTHYSKVYRKLTSNRWIISHDSSMNIDKPINIQKLCVEIIANVVKFENACKFIPKNVVCIEIAPRKFLTSLLKCNLTESLIVEVPFKVGNQQFIQIDHHQDNVNYPQLPESFLPSLGNLYMNGCTINLEFIYSHRLNGPAPVDTPFLSPLIKLDHSIDHLVRRFPEYFNSNSLAQGKVLININEKNKHFGFFHYNGYQVIPISALIHSLWSKFASLTAHSTNDLAVCLERVKLHRLALFDDTKLSFLIEFLPTNEGKYKFTIKTYSDSSVVMTGLVSNFDDSSGNETLDDGNDFNDSIPINVERNIFYGVLSRHGLHYQGDLRNVIQVNGNTTTGIMKTNQDWIVRFESMLQLASFFNSQGNSPTSDFITNNIPIRLDEIHCIPDRSFKESTIAMIYDKFSNIIRSKSIYIRGIQFGSFQSQLPCKLSSMVPRIETFIPIFNQAVCQPLETCVTIMIDHLIEFTDRHQQQLPITLITTTPSKSNGIKTRYDVSSLGDLIAHKLNQCRSSPCNWIKIDSLNQLTNMNNNNNNNYTKLDDNGNEETPSNRLLILETDNTTNLIDLISGPVISKASNFDFIIVRQSIIANNNDDNNYSNKCINYLKSNGLVIVSCSLSDQGYLYLIRWSIDPILINVSKVNPSFQLPQFSNEQQNNWLMVDNLSSSAGLMDRLEIVNQVKQQIIQLKWLINETDDGNDSKHCFDEFIPIGLTYTVLRNGVQGSYHYLPINLSSSSSSSLLSSTTSSPSSSKLLPSVTIGTSNLYHVNNESLIQLLSPSHYDTSIVICCNQIPDCGSLIGYSKVSDDDNGEIGIIKYNHITDDYLMIHRWAYNKKKWSQEEAATIPIPYSLAYYALIITGRLLRGETVLIGDGHSSVGCAILTICLSLRCTIYLTVETEDQKVNLIKRFPSLVDDQFLITTNSQEIEQTIKVITNGCGCDLVINTSANKSTSNDNKNCNDQVKGNPESMLKCLSVGGRCVDLNKSPMSVDDDLGLAVFLQNITYYGATPEGIFQPPPSNTETTGKSNHPHHRIADLLAKEINSGVICPLVDVDSAEIIEIEPKRRNQDSKQSTSSNNLPLVNIIIGQPGDIELEIIEKSRWHDKVSNFILIPINQSSKYMMTFLPSSRGQLSSSSSPPPPSSTSFNLSDSSISSQSSYNSFPLTTSSSTNHQPLTPIPTPTSTNNEPSPLNYHPYIINQLGLQGCSFVDVSDSSTGESIGKSNIAKYQQVLKDISKSYTINKVFLVYRSSYPDSNNQHTNHHYHPRHLNHHHHFANQLMIELLDYITNSSEISINFLTLISCSLTQDCSFIWPQLVRKCQKYGERSGVTSITINLTDLFSSDDPNYWSQLDQYISQLYCQLIDNNDSKDENSIRKANGVYKLTCKVDNQ